VIRLSGRPVVLARGTRCKWHRPCPGRLSVPRPSLPVRFREPCTVRYVPRPAKPDYDYDYDYDYDFSRQARAGLGSKFFPRRYCRSSSRRAMISQSCETREGLYIARIRSKKIKSQTKPKSGPFVRVVIQLHAAFRYGFHLQSYYIQTFYIGFGSKGIRGRHVFFCPLTGDTHCTPLTER